MAWSVDGSRGVDTSRNTYNGAAIGSNITLLNKTDVIVYCVCIRSNAGNDEMRAGSTTEGAVELEFRQAGGTFGDILVTGGAVRATTATALADDNVVATADKRAHQTGTFQQVGKECVGHNYNSLHAVSADARGNGLALEYQWALDFSNAPDNTTYEFRVIINAKAGGGPVTAGMITITTPAGPPPNAPSGVSATSVAQPVVTWTDNSTNENNFYVHRSTTSGFSPSNATRISGALAANTTSYTDTAAPSGTTLYYKVEAINANGSSYSADQGTATTPANAKIDTLDDAFDDGALGPNWESSVSSGTVTESGGAVTLTANAVIVASAELNSVAKYDLEASSFKWEVTDVGFTSTNRMYGYVAARNKVGTERWVGWRIYWDAANSRISLETRRSVYAGTFIHGSNQAYSATNHRWLRVTVTSTTVTWASSPDNSTWTTVSSVTRDGTTELDWSMTDMEPLARAEDSDGFAVGGSFKVQTFNDPTTGTTLRPTPVVMKLAVATPVVQPGLKTLQPGAVVARFVVPAPTLQSLRTLLPNAVIARFAVAAPTVVPGVRTLSPDAVVARFGIAAPTVVPGVATLRPDAIVARFLLPAPTLTTGLKLTPSAVVVRMLTAAPALSGALSLTPSPVLARLLVATPVVQPGVLTVTPGAVIARLAVAAVTLSTAAKVLPSSVVARLLVASPALTPGLVTLQPLAVVTRLAIATPSVSSTSGTQTVSPLAVTMSMTTAIPVLQGALSLAPAAIAMRLLAASPTVTRGTVTTLPGGLVIRLAAATPTVSGLLALTPSPVSMRLLVGTVGTIVGTSTLTPLPVTMRFLVGTPAIVGGEPTLYGYLTMLCILTDLDKLS